MHSSKRLWRLSTLAAGLVALAACYVVLPAIPAAAAPSSSGAYTLFGDSVLVQPGYNSPTAVQASFDGNTSYGGVDFGAPAGLTVNGLQNLSTEYQFTVGSCGLGSPRFVAAVTNGTTSGYIQFYIGPYPEYSGCPDGVWGNTGNLAGATNNVDTQGLPGGTFYQPYAAAQADFGSYTVTDIFLVLDNGEGGSPATSQFDNSQINGMTYTFESKDSCKDGGWQQFTSAPGPFKNQGDCVSYFATGGKNQ